MKSDRKCMGIYYDGKCECSECENCPHYKQDFKKEMESLMQIAVERYRKQGKELSDSERDGIYYSILGVYRNKNYGAAHRYVLSAELSLWSALWWRRL